jgi:hypothetical protein
VNSIHGTFKNGTVILDEPADFPEGAHVRVTLDNAAAAAGDLLSDGRAWPKTQEEIAAFVAKMDATPGLDASDEEYARMEADRLAHKALGIAETKARMERVTAMFP